MDSWKAEASERALTDRMVGMSTELDRLRKVAGLAESIGRLPSECLEDLKTAQDVRDIKKDAVVNAIKKDAHSK